MLLLCCSCCFCCFVLCLFFLFLFYLFIFCLFVISSCLFCLFVFLIYFYLFIYLFILFIYLFYFFFFICLFIYLFLLLLLLLLVPLDCESLIHWKLTWRCGLGWILNGRILRNKWNICLLNMKTKSMKDHAFLIVWIPLSLASHFFCTTKVKIYLLAFNILDIPTSQFLLGHNQTFSIQVRFFFVFFLFVCLFVFESASDS